MALPAARSRGTIARAMSIAAAPSITAWAIKSNAASGPCHKSRARPWAKRNPVYDVARIETMIAGTASAVIIAVDPYQPAIIQAAPMAPCAVRKYAPHTIHERQLGRTRM